MADTPEDTEAGQPQDADQDAAPEAPPLVVHGQYIKDLSFEAPGAPAVFAQLAEQQPDIDIHVSVQARKLEGDNFESVVQITATCKAGDATAFIVELSYGGVFSVNVNPDLLRPVLLIECPRLLFPFARHILANATRDGGFMPLMLAPVDFVALYQRHEQQDHAGEGSPDAPPDS